MSDTNLPSYYRTLVTVEVLSDEPLTFDNLEDLHQQIVWGRKIGTAKIFTQDRIDRGTMRKMLVSQNADPDFFDHDGDVYEDDDGLVAPPRYMRDTDEN